MSVNEHNLPTSAAAMKRVPRVVDQRIPLDADRLVSRGLGRTPTSAEAMRPDLPREVGIPTSAQWMGAKG